MDDGLSYIGRSGDRYSLDDGSPEDLGAGRRNELTVSGRRGSRDKLDGPEAREEHRKLLQWYYYERDRQAANRLEMATDHDFYDNEQWDPESAAIVEGRKQAALVFNEIAPMCDWVIGTERRARVDWKVLPRTEDDVEAADVKTKALKYLSDVNRSQLHRSRAFGDAVKGGVGWVDDGAVDDPTQERIYSRYEDWRCVLHDSSAIDTLGDEGRYVFRWRWVDEDVALAMFPTRRNQIRAAVEDWAFDTYDDEFGATETVSGHDGVHTNSRYAGVGSVSSAMVDAQRRRVKLIECQYRKPAPLKIIVAGKMAGTVFDARDRALVAAISNDNGATIIDKVVMRVYAAVFTEGAMLAWGPTAYRHNKFSLTPVYCYRRNRDRQPYGMVRRVRGLQMDINKRASKAQHLLNTNQIIGDADAFDDWEAAREEAQNPDGVLPLKTGAKVEIRSGVALAQGQVEIMSLNQSAIQRSFGVNDENLGRKTNAVSGEAIKARQIQGSVATTEPFDNLRWSTKAQGEKQLSLCEQFMSEARVIRLTDAGGGLEWVKINTPEVDADGRVRFVNDITSSAADFVVSEQDYAGTLRQVMFDSLTAIAQKQPPEIALKFLRMAFQYSDLPNKNEIVGELRKILGEPDPSKEPSPEEQQAIQEQQQRQVEMIEMQRQQALAAVEEQQAKARKIGAEAEKLMVEVDRMARGLDLQGMDDSAAADAEREITQLRERAAAEVERLSVQLQKVTADLHRALADKDAEVEVARLQAEAQVRAAELSSASDQRMQALQRKLEDVQRSVADATSQTAAEAKAGAAELAQRIEALAAEIEEKDGQDKEEAGADKAAEEAMRDQFDALRKAIDELGTRTEKIVRDTAPAPAPAAPAQAATAAAPAAPMAPTGQVAAPATASTGPRSIQIKRDKTGRVLGAEVVEQATAGGAEVRKIVSFERDGSGKIVGATVEYREDPT